MRVFTYDKPNPKQDLFLRDHHNVVIFGGARGGGKSWAVRLKAVLLCLKHDGIKVTIVRKSYPELTANHIDPLRAMLKCGTDQAIARYTDSKKEFVFDNGSKIVCKYLDTEKDLDRFQGLETHIMMVDEATQMTEYQLKTLRACVRGADTLPKRTYMTCNPSGVGMGYVKRIAVDRRFEENENPDDYTFIQSLVTDNYALLKNNKEYIKQLEELPDSIREAWLNGRWDAYNGNVFSEFRESPDPERCREANISIEDARKQHRWTHVIEPFDIPNGWRIYRSYDFGSAKPFSFAWWAVDFDGTMYRILELYGCTKTPNEGLKWTPSQQFEKAAEIEREHPWLSGKQITGVADPSIWDGSRGIPIIEEAEKRGIYFDKGDNKRIAGWMRVHEALKFDEKGFAGMYIFNNCKALIRTLPLLMYDEHKPEDVDSDMEDHAPDDCRYFVASRPSRGKLVADTYIPMIDPLDQFKKQSQGNNIDRFMSR